VSFAAWLYGIAQRRRFIGRSWKALLAVTVALLVEEGATFAIGLPPERCHLFREDGTACRRLHKEPGV
jgi:hypothetical protein